MVTVILEYGSAKLVLITAGCGKVISLYGESLVPWMWYSSQFLDYGISDYGITVSIVFRRAIGTNFMGEDEFKDFVETRLQWVID